MKESDIKVTMPLTTFNELKEYKDLYWELRLSLKNLFKESNEKGIDYDLNMNDVMALLKKTTSIKESSNINVIYERKRQDL